MSLSAYYSLSDKVCANGRVGWASSVEGELKNVLDLLCCLHNLAGQKFRGY